VEFFGWFDNNDTVFLTMEYLQFGDLAKQITPEITEWDAQQVTIQLLDGLYIMHQNGFTHRDLKPQVRFP
jgi:serine/threonine protein kinase